MAAASRTYRPSLTSTALCIIEKLDPPTGFGTFLIKQLADEVEFNEMTDGGHMVKMVIRLQT